MVNLFSKPCNARKELFHITHYPLKKVEQVDKETSSHLRQELLLLYQLYQEKSVHIVNTSYQHSFEEQDTVNTSYQPSFEEQDTVNTYQHSFEEQDTVNTYQHSFEEQETVEDEDILELMRECEVASDIEDGLCECQCLEEEEYSDVELDNEPWEATKEESADAWLEDPKEKAESCEFGDWHGEMKTQTVNLVFGVFGVLEITKMKLQNSRDNSQMSIAFLSLTLPDGSSKQSIELQGGRYRVDVSVCNGDWHASIQIEETTSTDNYYQGPTPNAQRGVSADKASPPKNVKSHALQRKKKPLWPPKYISQKGQYSHRDYQETRGASQQEAKTSNGIDEGCCKAWPSSHQESTRAVLEKSEDEWMSLQMPTSGLFYENEEQDLRQVGLLREPGKAGMFLTICALDTLPITWKNDKSIYRMAQAILDQHDNRKFGQRFARNQREQTNEFNGGWEEVLVGETGWKDAELPVPSNAELPVPSNTAEGKDIRAYFRVEEEDVDEKTCKAMSDLMAGGEFGDTNSSALLEEKNIYSEPNPDLDTQKHVATQSAGEFSVLEASCDPTFPTVKTAVKIFMVVLVAMLFTLASCFPPQYKDPHSEQVSLPQIISPWQTRLGNWSSVNVRRHGLNGDVPGGYRGCTNDGSDNNHAQGGNPPRGTDRETANFEGAAGASGGGDEERQNERNETGSGNNTSREHPEEAYPPDALVFASTPSRNESAQLVPDDLLRQSTNDDTLSSLNFDYPEATLLPSAIERCTERHVIEEREVDVLPVGAVGHLVADDRQPSNARDDMNHSMPSLEFSLFSGGEGSERPKEDERPAGANAVDPLPVAASVAFGSLGVSLPSTSTAQQSYSLLSDFERASASGSVGEFRMTSPFHHRESMDWSAEPHNEQQRKLVQTQLRQPSGTCPPDILPAPREPAQAGPCEFIPIEVDDSDGNRPDSAASGVSLNELETPAGESDYELL